MDAAYTQEMCTLAFPPGVYNRIPAAPDVARWNAYGGLNFSADRLAFIDGNHDVWLDGCYHANGVDRPLLESSTLHPEYLIVSGGHHWDSTANTYAGIAAEPQFIREAHKWEIRTVRRWLAAFEEWVPGSCGAVKT